ncbi:tellurite resistance TerB family protein [Aquimarina algicola]|uniref:TerB family tellurite resistance protein n=1 Tax=Aquimarina algicola TaxID=2589995 RepID=A0A504J886_9FLAO|nr:TerB family tellurite resistance protein [Aquimarina algicola]TPN87067.1 TerB family tellurite resistance protein [Aquimarina algicola]
MSISEIYESGIQKNNLAHFASIVNMAFIDGALNDEEKGLLSKFADKFDISEEQYSEVIKNPKRFALEAVSSKEERLHHLFDLFKMIFADNYVDPHEIKLIHQYAIGLGCSEDRALELIKKSIRIFQGKIDFEEYQYLIEKDQ